MPGNTKFHPYSKSVQKQLKIRDEQTENVVTQSLEEVSNVVAQFKSQDDGEVTGPPLNLPANATTDQLQLLINNLLSNEEPLPYSFFVNDTEITSSIHNDILLPKIVASTEDIITITYQPRSIFRVKAVTRCTSTLSGHTEAILCVQFSPDGSQLATGSGDTTVRIWDLNTETPQFTLTGHKNWVQIVAWSPDCKILASGSMDNTIRLWDTATGKPLGDALRGHTQCITSISWEPLHSNKECNRFASASRDGTVRVWDARLRRVLFSMSQHTAPVTCVKWGGEGLIYSGSRDKTIKVWDGKDGKLVRTLEGHAHWVNSLALSTDFALRSGGYDHKHKSFATREEAHESALDIYKTHKGNHPERLVSCSDDFTLFIWEPTHTKKSIARMTGHQQLVNHVAFSPDGRWLASASFDKSIKMWDGRTGKFVTTLRGHVGAVYQLAFSADSRLLLSGSRDSTCKVWDLRQQQKHTVASSGSSSGKSTVTTTTTMKLMEDLPGHSDEVFAVDWSCDGSKVASGGKDRVLKM
ncbi:hypothetical protein HK102_009011 [Quaeritorhiza haematococci]|nr:hypothetical protein HK102_009011 [Quaeritorhiza haematococci]